MDHPMQGHSHGMHGSEAAAKVVKDPVCGMDISPDSAFAHEEREGKTYYFCSAHCQQKFKADPAKYVAK